MRVLFPAKRFLFVSIVALLPVCSVSSAFAANHGYRVLYNFCSQPECGDGAQPGSVIADPSGHHLWGVTYPGGANNSGAVFELALRAKGAYSETVIYSFCSAANCADGSLPVGSLIRDKSGNLYGVTDEGGANGGGEVLELVRRRGVWDLETLYSFCAIENCADGKFPQAGLSYAGAQTGTPYDGSSPLFGTTSGGGTGRGVAYALRHDDSGWREQMLYSFCGNRSCSDGAMPEAPLIVGNDGNIYGTTAEGGDGPGIGAGIVFELTPNHGGWSETVLHSFCADQDCEDGALPGGGIAMDGAGTLYGFANAGGIVCTDTDHGSCGLIYSMAPAISQYTVLYTFGMGGRADDGANPSGSPLIDTNGNLYGTTLFGGGGSAEGVAFELTNSGLKVLHTFCASAGDGCEPDSVIRDGKGHLFGTTSAGGTGTDSSGTIFELKP